MAIVKIPQPLRSVVEGKNELEIGADTVEQVLRELESKYPAIKERIKDEEGSLRRFINVFVDGNDIRHLKGVETPVQKGSEVCILPAIAGG
ncbi:MAG: ubiquitin-like small modifier protein 1 [Elusimicrobiota bacterium]